MRLAVFILALLSGCSAFESKDCPTVGCTDRVLVTVTAREALPNGPYTIDATLDGKSVHAVCDLAMRDFPCGWMGPPLGLARDASGAGLVIGLHGAPKVVELSISFEGRTVAAASFAPRYTTVDPDGSCGPSCRSGSHDLTIDPIVAADAGAD